MTSMIYLNSISNQRKVMMDMNSYTFGKLIRVIRMATMMSKNISSPQIKMNATKFMKPKKFKINISNSKEDSTEQKKDRFIVR